MESIAETVGGVDLTDILARHPNAGRDALIPILQEVQDTFGYLSRETIGLVGGYLGLPTSKIYGVATFYNQFRFAALGKYHIQVCRGTACHVKGSASVLDDIKQILQLQPGETSRDGVFSLEVVACIGACGLAPVIKVNDEFHAEMTASKLDRVFKALKKEAQSNE
jgi:NADH-quinone oxidoreductase subunit E